MGSVSQLTAPQVEKVIVYNYFSNNRYVKDHPGAHDQDLKSLKDFMKHVAFGIDGMEGAKEEDKNYPGQGTVLSYWKNFTRGRHRQNIPFSKQITSSVRNVRISFSHLVYKHTNLNSTSRSTSQRIFQCQ